MTARTVGSISLALVAVALSAASVSSLAPDQVKPPAGVSISGGVIYTERCASCHDPNAGVRAPSRETLAAMSVQQIAAALDSTGVMAVQGKDLSAEERQAVASFLSAGAAGAAQGPGLCADSSAPMPDPASMPMWNGWGNDLANTHFQNAKAAGLSAADVPKLTLKWAFGFTGTTATAGQPAIAGGRVFVGNNNAMFYSLDLRTGCTYWTFKADGGIRTAPSIARVQVNGAPRLLVMFGDVRANAYALDAQSGAMLWKLKVDDHAMARVTGAPTFHNGRLYVPVSSTEEVPGANVKYPCCTFRGSVVAIDAATGKQLWKTYTIPEEPKMVGQNASGTPIWKPAGAAVWTSPTIDVERGRIYIATGNAYTHPAPASSDAVIALDLTSGKTLWTQQVTPDDTFVIGCKPGVSSCPDNLGPDYDFGNSPILRTLTGGRRILTLGQKSGMVYGLAPDDNGKIVWQMRAGKGSALGGIEWGSAADERNIYVPVSDVLLPGPEAGGLFAFDLATGKQLWHTPAPALNCTSGPGCTGAQSAAISVIPGAVFSGSVDGHLRAYSTTDGKIIWQFNTMQPFETVNGVKGQGGSIDAAGPVIAGGMVLTNSGYGQWRGKAGNVLLAFGLP
jgi:polyvinyl alcohol dehydrogenase (cytochrome)